ncbi:leucine-rich repeat neuronal protein 3-like [Penaeus indicus]|uniref:leucine-rich repeat neuronal protein 3-like n=1 Tax=Penaeus indicus TaxID=29960 RepID=UPI00300CAC40
MSERERARPTAAVGHGGVHRAQDDGRRSCERGVSAPERAGPQRDLARGLAPVSVSYGMHKTLLYLTAYVLGWCGHVTAAAAVAARPQTWPDAPRTHPDGAEVQRNRTLWKRKSSQSIVCVILSLAVLCSLPAATEAFCPNGCDCDDASLTVNCQNTSLEVVPILLNPRVQTILLTRNRIKALSRALVFYTDLKELDISHNDIATLGAKNFESQKNLAELRVSHNKLSAVEAASLEGLAGLRVLLLSDNLISSVDDGAFRGLVSLIELNLSNNRLKSLRESSFAALPSLWTLNLGGNLFDRVPSSSLLNLSSLLELDLSDNQISQVPGRAFQGAANLAYIRLDKNNISAVNPAAFWGLSELRRLAVADNRLEQVPTLSFSGLPDLQDLDLSGNLFEELPEDGFNGLASLVSLTVSRCPRLSRVSSEAFLSTVQLETLVLSHNPRLASLAPTTLTSLLNLRHVDLRACGLLHITPTQVPLQQLASLMVSGNPLHCNCSMVWLSRIAADDNASLTVDSPTCASPPNLYGVSLRELGTGGAGCDGRVGVWTIVICVGVGATGLLIIGVFLCCRLRKRRKKRQKRILQDKRPWGEVWRMEDPLATTRLTPTPMNGDALSHYPLASPTRLRLPPRLPPDHPLHQQLSLHQQHAPGRAQQCPFATLHPVYHPLLHPPAAAHTSLDSPTHYSDYPPLHAHPRPHTLPNHSSHPAVMPLGPPPPIPPLDEPPNWYATIGSVGGFNDDDEGDKRARGERDGGALDPPDVTASTPRKVPVTYV